MALIKLNTNSLLDDAVTTDKLVNDGNLGNRNLIINGAMTVAQRGTSSTSSGYQTVDRWLAAFGGSGAAVTQSQESLSSSDAPYALGLRNYFRSTVTGTSTDTSAYHQILQYVEAQNMAQSGWNLTSTSSYITLSFWVRSSVAGTYAFYVESMDGTQQSYSHAFTLSANTWTKVTKTIPGNSNITINNDNGQGLLFDILAHFGTDYTTASSTEDAWKTFNGTDICKDYPQNWLNTSGATFDFTGVQLEVGETVTSFEHETFSETLHKCQRYYEKSHDYSVAPTHGFVGGSFEIWQSRATSGTTAVYYTIQYKVRKRASASVTTFNNTASGSGYYHISGNADYTNGSTVGGDRKFSMRMPSTGNQNEYLFSWVSDAEL
jgi:hypothetical protein